MPVKALTIPLGVGLSDVGVQAGDFEVNDIGIALNPYLYQIVDEMLIYHKERKIIVSLPLVKVSQKFRGILNGKDFHTAEVNGGSQDRAEAPKDFDEGKHSVLCNSTLLTGGWDCPSIDCTIMLRPAKVCSLCNRMVGKDTCLCEEKDHLLLLDSLWHADRHEPCHPTSPTYENEEIAEKVADDMEKAPEMAMDIKEAEQSAAEDVIQRQEEALARKFMGQQEKKEKLVDPLQSEMNIQAEDLSSYVPASGRECSSTSEKQLQALRKFDIYPDEIGGAGKASLLLSKLNRRKAGGLATSKRIRLLKDKGFQHIGT